MKRIILSATVALTLAACQGGPEYWTGAEAQHGNTVEKVMIDHDVRFAAGSSTLGAGERDRLVAFLHRHDVDYNDDLYVAASGLGNDRVGRARRTAIERVLRHEHLKLSDTPAPGLAAPSGGVTLTVGRYVVVPPNCPDWSKPSNFDPNNTVSSNYGCATETNLGLMIADPRDLVVGRSLGPAEGAGSARSVARYRAGGAPKARAQSTK
jgi:pilus assembly protein CpaD